jgi:hypothetical protein
MPERIVNRVSGHLTQVGATKDPTALHIDLAAITQAGGWKSTHMPPQYVEKISAARSEWLERPKNGSKRQDSTYGSFRRTRTGGDGRIGR